ncbi:hypothetical protein BT93_H1102 [Corymbia citriodora subsp. variegata]|nr:hypothetical protein BT93_H1102 [Corymbia citriodora subsp. variegata]
MSSSNPSLSTRSVSHSPPPPDFACSFSDSRWNRPSNEPRRRCCRIHLVRPTTKPRQTTRESSNPSLSTHSVSPSLPPPDFAIPPLPLPRIR